MAAKVIQTSSQRARGASEVGELFCYIGPNIPGYVHSGQLFSGEREQVLRSLGEAVGQYPLIKALMVSGEALPAARLKVKEPGNGYYASFQRLRNELAEAARSKAEKEAERNA